MRTKPLLIVTAAVALTISLACAGQPEADDSAAETTQATAPQMTDPGAPEVITGEVLETMDSGGYTYFLMDTGEDQIWAAASEFSLEAGETVTIPLEMPMEDFHSTTLDRTFEMIYFVSVVGREGGDPSGSEEEALGLPPGHPTLAGFDASAEKAEPVARAEDALPIADVWARKAELAGSKVTITGRVVKFNGGILGSNWLHLQDGSGDAEAGTHDLTVTTLSPASVGDVVTATGTLAIDRDFGAGYTYAVILEEAEITK